MKKLLQAFLLLLVFALHAQAEDFTAAENKLFMQFISTQLGQQDPAQIATVFGQLLSKNEQANDQIRIVMGQYLDGEIMKAQATKAGLEAQKAAAEVELDAKIELFQGLKSKLEQ